MKLKEAPENYEIQIGDTIKADHGWCVNTYKVSRVTPKYAFIPYNDKAEGKFKRVYRKWGYYPLPRPKWPTTKYTVLIEDK